MSSLERVPLDSIAKFNIEATNERSLGFQGQRIQGIRIGRRKTNNHSLDSDLISVIEFLCSLLFERLF